MTDDGTQTILPDDSGGPVKYVIDPAPLIEAMQVVVDDMKSDAIIAITADDLSLAKRKVDDSQIMSAAIDLLENALPSHYHEEKRKRQKREASGGGD